MPAGLYGKWQQGGGTVGKGGGGFSTTTRTMADWGGGASNPQMDTFLMSRARILIL